jgi:hypothetical protein
MYFLHVFLFPPVISSIKTGERWYLSAQYESCRVIICSLVTSVLLDTSIMASHFGTKLFQCLFLRQSMIEIDTVFRMSDI